MATNTTNIGLIKPAGTDKVRIAQINQNMDIIDAAIGAVGSTSLQSQVAAVDSGLAIVSNGNTHVAITSGQYVYIRNHSSLSEGLYKATAAIAANVALTTSNVTKLSNGSANDLKSRIDSLNGQLTIKVGTNLTSVDAVNSALNTLKDSLSDMNVRNVSFTCSTGIESPFTNASYGGVFVRHSSTRARVIVMRSGYHEILTGWLGNNGWTWESIDIAGREVVETPTAPTYTNVVNTSYSNRIYVKKCGKMVTFGGEFKANGDISRNAVVIATGCPPALSNSLGQFTAFYGTSPYITQLDVDSSGNFSTFYGTDIPSGAVVRFGTTYITSE